MTDTSNESSLSVNFIRILHEFYLRKPVNKKTSSAVDIGPLVTEAIKRGLWVKRSVYGSLRRRKFRWRI